MRNRLPSLHNPDNRCLRLKLPISRHADVCFFVFFFRLFQLDRVDLDAVFGVCEGGVQGERVCGGDFAAFWGLGKGTEFGAGEGLEGPLDFGVGWKVVSRFAREVM
jgi:hypothetical protein